MKSNRNDIEGRSSAPCSPSSDVRQCGEVTISRNGYVGKLERDLDGLRKVVRHCRLFIVDRKGYVADEDMERELIKQEIDAILSENS